MTTLHNTVTQMDNLRKYILEVIKKETTFDDSFLSDITPVAVCNVLRTIPQPFRTQALNPLFLKLLETDQQAFVSALCIVFTKEAFENLGNAIHFLKVTSGPGFSALKNTHLLFEILTLFKKWIAAQKQRPERYVSIEDVPANEIEILKTCELIEHTKIPGLLRFRVVDITTLSATISKKIHYANFPQTSIFSSCVIPDDIYPKTVALLCQCFSKTVDEMDNAEKVPQPNALDRNVAGELAGQLFNIFSDRYRNNGRFDELAYLDQIVWLMLTYLGSNADTGMFRPYAQIDKRNAKMLVEYLLINPREHLLLFLMQNRDAQYQALSKYGLNYDGKESSGTGPLWTGLEVTFEDVPLATMLLEPALEKMYKDCHKNNKLGSLWKMLKNDWIRPNIPATSLHPAVVRRATVRVMLKIALEAAPSLKRDIYKVLSFFVLSAEGLPKTSDKVFAEISKLSEMFKEPHCAFVYRLIRDDIARSGICKIPTSYFAFECLLKLIASGHTPPINTLRKLLRNVEFQKRDNFEFNILGNIVRFCGKDSPLLKGAIREYQKSQEWQNHASYYSKESVNQYLLEKAKTSKFSRKVARAANVDSDARKLLRIQLVNLADTNFGAFLIQLRKTQKGRPLAEVFADRSFVVKAVETQLHKLNENQKLSQNNSVVSQTIKLLSELAEDPDPDSSSEHDKRVRAGEQLAQISGIRTHVCYLICDAVNFKSIIHDLWNVTRRLMLDKNAYVVYHAFNPFAEILRRRNWNTTVKTESVQLLWDIFNSDNLPAHQKKILHGFLFVKDLSEDDAEKVLLKFWNMENIEKLIVFYAVYRKKLETNLGPFDDSRFKDLLNKAIDDENSNLPLLILRAFLHVCYDSIKDVRELMPYLFQYTKPVHIQEEIYGLCRTIIGQLLDNAEHFQITDIRRFILNTTKLGFNILKNKDNHHQNSWIFSIEQNELTIFFNLDRVGFYEYISLIEANLALCKWLPLLSQEIFEVLLAEVDPEYVLKISLFADRLVEYDPSFYSSRQMWLDRQKVGDK